MEPLPHGKDENILDFTSQSGNMTPIGIEA